jgi:hypothetical protein
MSALKPEVKEIILRDYSQKWEGMIAVATIIDDAGEGKDSGDQKRKNFTRDIRAFANSSRKLLDEEATFEVSEWFSTYDTMRTSYEAYRKSKLYCVGLVQQYVLHAWNSSLKDIKAKQAGKS